MTPMKDNIKTVMVKYIDGGKEVVKYDSSTGRCWVERTKGEITDTVKEYSMDITPVPANYKMAEDHI